MKRQERWKNNKWFIYENVNPKDKITGDCVIRALSKAMDKTWDEIYTDLFNYGLKYKYMINDDNNYKRYLKDMGWEIQKQPRKFNNTKYTVREFIEEFRLTDKTIIAKVGAHHIMCIKNGTVRDIWDSSNEKIGIYWIKNN